MFSVLQPFPNDIYELSAVTLIDVHGGILFQPGLQWKPRGSSRNQQQSPGHGADSLTSPVIELKTGSPASIHSHSTDHRQ